MRRNWRGEEALGETRAVVKAAPVAGGLDWADIFGRKALLHVEIGVGKGDFILSTAGLNPRIDYVGIERSLSILYIAAKKNEESPRSNLRFLPIDAGMSGSYFASGSVDRIYLNFSDPWPKTRHESRRLTAKGKLSLYRELLRPGGQVFFKTDQSLFFEFSMKEFINEGWSVGKICRDLHNSGIEGNIMTEYERRFAALGMPIYSFVATSGGRQERPREIQANGERESTGDAHGTRGARGVDCIGGARGVDRVESARDAKGVDCIGDALDADCAGGGRD